MSSKQVLTIYTIYIQYIQYNNIYNIYKEYKQYITIKNIIFPSYIIYDYSSPSSHWYHPEGPLSNGSIIYYKTMFQSIS